MNPSSDPSYRGYLQQAVSSSAAPYGYTLTIWTCGAVTIQTQGHGPSTLDAFLLLCGAVLAFLAVGGLAFGGADRNLDEDPNRSAPVWAGFHIPSVGAALAVCSLLAHELQGHVVWPAVGLAATAIYLIVLAGQRQVTSRLG